VVKHLIAGVLIVGALNLTGTAVKEAAEITIDYPAEGSIFPPEITAPTFLWRDAMEWARNWI